MNVCKSRILANQQRYAENKGREEGVNSKEGMSLHLPPKDCMRKTKEMKEVK